MRFDYLSWLVGRSVLLWLIFINIILATDAYSSNKVIIFDQSTADIKQWRQENFSGQTTYQLSEANGKTAIQAISKSSASGLYKEESVNIQRYPYLHWQWLVERPITNDREQSKQGDDFAARVYVVASDGFFFWSKKVICYVWGDQTETHHSWPNPYAGDAVQMVKVNYYHNVNKWQHHQRNVYQDFQTLFGKKIKNIEAVAIMTDTDDTNQQAVAYYADIYFSRD